MSKNTRNRILLTAVAALLLVVVAVGGTMAWLQDTTEDVVNTFTTTNVDIELDETTDNEYEVIPGVDLEKDPTVTVIKGSEKSWVFVKVVYPTGTDNYLTWSYDTAWTTLSTTSDTNTKMTTVILYKVVEEVSADTPYSVLADNKVTVSSDLTNAQMDELEALNPSLTFTAYAIQYAANEAEVTEGADAPTANQLKAGAEAAWEKVKNLELEYETQSYNGKGTNLTQTNP